MKKNQTRMAAGLAAALLLTAQGASAQSHPEQEEAPNRPGFFRQLGTSLKNAGGQMIGGQPGQGGSKPSASTGSIYAPVSGPGKLPGLFKTDNHQLAQQGRLDWPRVALTYTPSSRLLTKYICDGSIKKQQR